jgi:Ca2+-binding EF-hand superfamily protein
MMNGPGGSHPPISRIMFEKYDDKETGKIDIAHFRNMTYQLGHAMTEEEAAVAMAAIDSDGNGTVEYDEFLTWWKTEVCSLFVYTYT